MPEVVLTCAPAGSGKSRYARELERAGYARLSFDQEAWDRGLRAHPVPTEGVAQVHAALQRRLLELVLAGRDVVVDTSFWAASLRQTYRDVLAPLGVTPVVHRLVVPLETLLERVADRSGDGPDQVRLSPDTVRGFVAGFQEPTPQEGPLVVLRWDATTDRWLRDS